MRKEGSKIVQAVVSIIIPVYNAARFLSYCLDSILNQSFGDFEVLCIDDGSTDNSAQIIREYCKKDHRVRLIQQAHSTAGDARNAGIREAQGDYLLFLDADDIFDPQLLSLLYEKCIETEADVCVCDAEMFQSDNGEKIPWSTLDLHGICAFCVNPIEIANSLFMFSGAVTWNKMYRRETVSRQNLYYQSLPRANDLYFVYCMMVLSEKIAIVNKPLIRYRVGVQSSLQSNNDRNPDCFFQALCAVYKELTARGKIDAFEKGFVKAAAYQIFYHFDSFKKKESFEYLYQLLHNGGLTSLGFDRISASQFEERAARLRLRWITLPSKKTMLSSRVCRRLAVAWCLLCDRGVKHVFMKTVQKLIGR